MSTVLTGPRHNQSMTTATAHAPTQVSSRRVVLVGLGLFLVALGLIVAALAQATMALFLAGTVVGGVAPQEGHERRSSSSLMTR